MRRLILVVLATLALSACNNYSTPPDQQAIHEAGGPFTDQALKNCIPPSKKGYDGVSETHYYYPVSQRSFDATGGSGAEAQPFTVVSKDNAEMTWPMTVTFTLTRNCDQLKTFHIRLGNRFTAYMDGNQTRPGWTEMLNFVIGKPADTLLDRVAQQYNWRDLYNDPETKAAAENEVESRLAGMVAQQAGGQFFTFDNVLLLKPTPVDPSLTAAINQEQAAVARANAQEAQADAEVESAKAQTQVAEERAKQKQAEISAYQLPGMTPEEAVKAYNEAQALEKGMNPYQPNVQIPGLSR